MHYSKLTLMMGIIALAVNVLSHEAFGYGLMYTPQISLEENYNDNIFFTPNKPVSDLVNVVNGGTAIDLSTERDELTFNGNLTNTTYLKNHEQDDTDFSVRANESHMLSERLNIVTNAGYIKDSSPDRDLESTGLILGTSVRKTTNYSLKGMYSLSELLSTDITYGYENQRFNTDQFVDSSSQNIDMGYTIDAGSIVNETSLRLDLLYERDKYLNSLLQKADTYEWRAGASHQMTELMYFSFYVGTSQTISSYLIPILWFELEEKNHSRGIIGQLTLGYKTEYTDSTVSLSRNIASVSGEAYLSERTMATIDSSLTISRTVKASLSAQYIMNKETGNNASQENIQQFTMNLSPGLRIELSDDFFLSLSHIYSQLRDQGNSITYRRNLSTLNIEYRHSFFN